MSILKKILSWFLHNKILSCILVLSAFLRLYRIEDYITFLGDEGRDVLVVWNILHGHLTLLGPTSSVGGFFLGPIYYYFMTPFLWAFQYNPVGPAVMIALLGIVTVWFVYKIGAEFFNPFAGLTAAFFYAISPLVLTYSRSSWNPNAMPFFTLLTLYVLYKAVTKKSAKLFVISGILFGIDMQLHYIETFVIPVIALYIPLGVLFTLSQKVKKNTQLLWTTVKNYCFVLGGFFAGFSPFLAFEARHDFLNFKNIFTFVFHSKDTGAGANFLFAIGTIFFRIFGRLVFAFPQVESFKQYPIWELVAWGIVVGIVSVASVEVLIWQLKQKKKDATALLQKALLLLWLGFGVLLFGFYKKSIYDYYFEFLFPLPFLLIGNLFSVLWQKKNMWKSIVVLSTAALAVINAVYNPLMYAPNRQLNQMRDISSFVLSKTDGKPFNLALITGGNSDHAYRYFLTVWGHPPVTIENQLNDPQRKTVTGQLFVICESLPCFPLGNSLWEIAGFGRAQIAGHWQLSVVDIYKLTHYQGK